MPLWRGRGEAWGWLTTSATHGDAGTARERGARASLPDLHLEVGGREHLHELRVGLGREGRIDLVKVGAGVGVGCRVRVRAGAGLGLGRRLG